ncbi:MAG: DegT/DnrJ/EryC1/StrS family aminotransferase [Pseudonocardia sp.]|nr:DegT/DnrJ/EryC1/StrS family aminotransferase [Pseudonocardia sp.]
MNGIGDQVADYEHDLATRLDVRHVIATSSGTTAIHTALYAAGIRPGDEVLVPALSVVMTASPIIHLGARPVAVDSTPDGTGLDLDDLAAKTGPRTHAIVPVLLWGRADPHADLLLDHAHRHRLAVVVDACQAIGTARNGRQVGLDATAACFSTHANKILATGEGGFVATDHDTIADQARAYRSHWSPAPPGEDPLARPAQNFRLAAPLAALGRDQLRHLDAHLHRRRHQTSLFLDQLDGAPGLDPAPAVDGWNGYSPVVRLHLPRPRAFSEHLAACGVPNSTGTFRLIPLDQRAVFADHRHPPCRTAAAFLDSTLAVALTAADDDHIRRCAATITKEAARWADA